VTVALVAVAILAGTLAVALALSVRWGMKAKDSDASRALLLADEKTAHGKTTIRAERAEFEGAKDKDALAIMTKRAETLAEELADARARTSLGAGLAPDDVRGRVLREAGASEAGDPLPAQPGAALPDKPAAAETISGAVSGLIDVLR